MYTEQRECVLKNAQPPQTYILLNVSANTILFTTHSIIVLPLLSTVNEDVASKIRHRFTSIPTYNERNNGVRVVSLVPRLISYGNRPKYYTEYTCVLTNTTLLPGNTLVNFSVM